MMKKWGSLEISWFPIVSEAQLRRWDDKVETPRLPSKLPYSMDDGLPNYRWVDNQYLYDERLRFQTRMVPSAYTQLIPANAKTAGDLITVKAWEFDRVEYEYGMTHPEGEEVAVRFHYTCDNLIDETLVKTVKQYRLCADGFSLYRTSPIYWELSDMRFTRRDELSRGYVATAAVRKEDLDPPFRQIGWQYVVEDRTRVWLEQYGYDSSVANIKWAGGPTDWNVELYLGAAPLNEAADTYPPLDEQMTEVLRLVKQYRAQPFPWLRNYR